jgi:hypothetical protein
MKPEDMNNQELANALEDEAIKQPLYNYTAQLYASASARIRKIKES